ncbi:MAG: hypothetical protein OXG82_19600 [Gammaproteobacteria bacterium]|nr:hypothetical protein [Gammaproteobacteria bacterium]
MKLVPTVVLLLLAGCATQAEREAAAAKARAEWEACVDEHMETAYAMHRLFGGDPFSATVVGEALGRMVAQECGSGGLDGTERTAYILRRAEVVEADHAAQRKESE